MAVNVSWKVGLRVNVGVGGVGDSDLWAVADRLPDEEKLRDLGRDAVAENDGLRDALARAERVWLVVGDGVTLCEKDGGDGLGVLHVSVVVGAKVNEGLAVKEGEGETDGERIRDRLVVLEEDGLGVGEREPVPEKVLVACKVTEDEGESEMVEVRVPLPPRVGVILEVTLLLQVGDRGETVRERVQVVEGVAVLLEETEGFVAVTEGVSVERVRVRVGSWLREAVNVRELWVKPEGVTV